MAAPSDSARQGTNVATAGTTHAVNVGSPAAGTLLIVLARFAAAPGTVTFTGYTSLNGAAGDSSDATDDTTIVFYRWADGSEGATDNLTTANSVKAAFICWEVTGAVDPSISPPQISTVQVGTTTANTANAASVVPALGTNTYLFLTMSGGDGETAYTAAPTNYANLATANSGTGGAVATNCFLGGASRQLTTGSAEDAGAFTHGAHSNGWTAYTVVISPPNLKAGAGISPRTAAGTHAGTSSKTGVGISPRVGSGTKSVPISKSGTAMSGYVPFPQFATSVTDDFNRANENPMSTGNWNASASTTMQISSNRIEPVEGQAGHGQAQWDTNLGAHEVTFEIDGPFEMNDYISWETNDDAVITSIGWQEAGGETLVGFHSKDPSGSIFSNTVTSIASGDAIGFRFNGLLKELWLRRSGTWSQLLTYTGTLTPGSRTWQIHINDNGEQGDLEVDNFSVATVGTLVGQGFTGGGVATKETASGNTYTKAGAASIGGEYLDEVLRYAAVSYWPLDNATDRTEDVVGANTLAATGTNFTTQASVVPNGMGVAGATGFDNGTSTGRLTLADSSTVDAPGTDSYTISAWARLNVAADANYRRFLSWMDEGDAGTNGYQLVYQNTAGFYAVRRVSGTDVGANWQPTGGRGASGVRLDEPYHLAHVYDGADIRLYVNGVLRDTEPSSGSQGAYASDLVIGAGQFGGNSCKADVDDVVFFSAALSAAQVAQLYGQPQGATGGGVAVRESVKAGAGVSEFTASGTDVATFTKAGISQTGLLPFPQYATSVTDDFNRANETPLSGNGWTADSIRLVSNTIRPPSGQDFGSVRRTVEPGAHEFSIEVRGFETGDYVEWYTGDTFDIFWQDTTLHISTTFGHLLATRTISALSDGDALGLRVKSVGLEGWVRYSGTWQKVTEINSGGAFTTTTTFLDLLDSDADGTFNADNFSLVAISGSLVGDGMKVFGVAQKISGGGATYEKTGAGISAFVGSGGDALTHAETGTAISAHTASGADAATFAEAGAGIVSALIGSGTDAVTFTEAGTGVSARIASGADAVTSSETGTGVTPFTGTADATWTVNRAGAATSPRVGSGADAFTATETGAGVIQAFIASGTSDTALLRQGAAVSAFTASAADAVTFVEAGTAISVRTASGADAVTFVESGTAISERVGSGADADTLNRTGAAVSPRVASGGDAVTFAETGAGVTQFVGAGTRARELPRTGTAITGFVAAGTRAVDHLRSGTAIAGFTASGADATTHTETGTGISPFTAAGTGLKQGDKTGAAVSVLTASGADVFTATETGSGISVRVASGADAHTATETGAGISPFTASAPSAEEAVNTGAGVSELTASGTRAKESSRTGTAVSAFTASGADADTFVESGAGITVLVASGTKALQGGATYEKSGSATAGLTASGGDAVTSVEAGSATSILTGSGADVVTFVEAGAGISARVAAGADAATFVESGAAISERTGTAGATWTLARAGAGVAPFTASGTRAKDSTRTGTAVLVGTSSGVDVIEATESGTAVSSRVASGADQFNPSETGTATSDRTGTGDGQWTVPETGVGILGATGSGTVTKSGDSTGRGISGFTGTGHAEWITTETGTAFAPFSASAADAATSSETATAVSPFTAAGARSVEHIRSGAAVAAFTGAGGATWTLSRAGTGIIGLTGSGDPTWNVTKSGAGIIGFTGSGSGSLSGDKTGSATAVLTASGARRAEHLRSGACVSMFVASGDAVLVFAEAGTGTVGFTVAGDALNEFDQAGTAISVFTAAGPRLVELDRTGTAILVMAASGATESLTGVFLGELESIVTVRAKAFGAVSVLVDSELFVRAPARGRVTAGMGTG